MAINRALEIENKIRDINIDELECVSEMPNNQFIIGALQSIKATHKVRFGGAKSKYNDTKCNMFVENGYLMIYFNSPAVGASKIIAHKKSSDGTIITYTDILQFLLETPTEEKRPEQVTVEEVMQYDTSGNLIKASHSYQSTQVINEIEVLGIGEGQKVVRNNDGNEENYFLTTTAGEKIEITKEEYIKYSTEYQKNTIKAQNSKQKKS